MMTWLPQTQSLALLPAAERGGAVRAWLTGRDRAAVVSTPAGEALAPWQRLAWDTRLLDLEVGRIDCIVPLGDGDAAAIRSAALDGVLAAARGQGIRYLTMRIDAADAAMLHALEARGFQTVDGLLTFARSSAGVTAPADFPTRFAVEADIPAMRATARAIYRLDRFHRDPHLDPARADDLHAEWVENSVRGQAADFVVAHEADGAVRGFVTCSMDRSLAPWLGSPVGVIVLVGTDPRYQGRRIASLLTLACVAEFARRGAAWVQVGTQLCNVAASRTYEGCGFRLIASSLTLRALLD